MGLHRLRADDEPAVHEALNRRGSDAVPHEDGHWTVAHARVEDVGRLAAEAGLTVLELAAEEGTLEQAYLDLTAAEAEFAARSEEV